MCVKWELVISGLSAVGTLTAAAVALWQSSRPYRDVVKLKIKSNDIFETNDGAYKTVETQFIVKNRNLYGIAIQSCGFTLHKGKNLVPIQNDTGPLVVPKLCERMLVVDQNKLDETIKYAAKCEKKKRLKRHFHFYVYNKSGKAYYCKSKKRLNEYLRGDSLQDT